MGWARLVLYVKVGAISFVGISCHTIAHHFTDKFYSSSQPVSTRRSSLNGSGRTRRDCGPCTTKRHGSPETIFCKARGLFELLAIMYSLFASSFGRVDSYNQVKPFILGISLGIFYFQYLILKTRISFGLRTGVRCWLPSSLFGCGFGFGYHLP